ncbi:MAG TPA: AIR synthase family protein [Thermodesulfobacteriota bacterium]|nr:AIR synthase family protein [Thermodesulfobacteriota bacterium]
MGKTEKKLSAGKLPIKVLERFLKRYASADTRVVVGAAVGLDSAVIDFDDRYLIAKTDPITFVAEDIGVYAIHINANDIAVMGGIPRWFLATVLLPEGSSTVGSAERIFSQLSRACRGLGVSLCGGHTEVTFGIDRPIVIGQMLGEVEKEGLITSAGARPGDAIILTKGVAVEATSIMARVKEVELLKKGFSRRFVSRCKNFLQNPGLSVLKEAQVAIRSGRVRAMHDPTEGGLASGLHELAIASSCGILVEREKIPVFPETKRLCEFFGLDPLGIIASGSLIISVDPGDAPRVARALERSGIRASRIGVVRQKRSGVKILDEKGLRPLGLPERDEITRIL